MEKVVTLLSRGSLIQFPITKPLSVVTLSIKIECVEFGELESILVQTFLEANKKRSSLPLRLIRILEELIFLISSRV